MNIADLDRPMLKLILRTSQGFTSPGSPIIKKPIGPGQPRPRPVGHAFSHHVRGAAGLASFSEASRIEGKTRFNSMDDQAEALWLALNTAEGLRKYRDLDPNGCDLETM